MNILVAIKQVPETSKVKMDPVTGTMIREGVESIINPLDLYALEVAIGLAGRTQGKTTALSMGPAKAEEALREAIAMGCDGGVLLCHRDFAGSDTWATSYALSRAAATIGGWDLLLCGERATDGDTAQVGPGMAAWLDVPVATYVSGIVECRQKSIVVRRLVEDGYETLEVDLPCVLTVVKEIASPRLPTLRGKQKAKNAAIPVWGPSEIGADPSALGLKGSPTRVVKVESPKITRHGDIRVPRDPADMEKALDDLVAFLAKRDLLPD